MWNQNPKQWVAEGQYLGLIFQSKSKFSSSKNLGNLQLLSAPLSIQVLANSMTSVPLSRPAWSVARCPAIWSRFGAAQNNLERMPMCSVRSSKSVTILQNSIRVNCIMLDHFTKSNPTEWIHDAVLLMVYCLILRRWPSLGDLSGYWALSLSLGELWALAKVRCCPTVQCPLSLFKNQVTEKYSTAMCERTSSI